ncbi:hypothetical protein [Blastococcus sp. LR1]|uniref:hypothetical protein n=1 Tax=Blastococcus sp. LR1 TaxID=2877000 RepID=UPI001CC9CACC|nr:hypothetical protein [Blastococcus sp. LR1]MCA0144192.1 hypothetical protein [Blastococcus sp. LR1]
MNAWLLRAPRWKIATLMGVVLAPLAVLFFGLTGDRSWATACVMGIALAAVCAPVLGLATARTIQDASPGLEGLPGHARARVELAARRGPVPADTEERRAALRLVEDRLSVVRATRTRAGAFCAALVLVSGLLALARSPWWWIAVAAGLAMTVAVVVGPRRLDRRAELLREP